MYLNTLPLDLIVIASGYLGVSALGSMTLVNAFTSFIFIIPLSYSLAVQYLIEGSIIESSDIFESVSRSRLLYTLAILYGLLITAIFFIILNNLPSEILGIYINDSEMKE